VLYVGVIGPGSSDAATASVRGAARDAGRALAGPDTVVVCGGLGGVMEAVSEGVSERGGRCIGLLPGVERREGNRYLSLALPTGLGQGRNLLVVAASDVLLAIGRGLGTLSEIALALRAGKHVVGLDSWQLSEHGELMHPVGSVPEAVALVQELGRAQAS
jgi:uncharacterized protein (TIGR00725 family)